MSDRFDLAGRRIVITGGGGVLCGELAKSLAEAGAIIAVLDVDEAAAQTVARAITDRGGTVLSVTCDVTSAESLEQAVQRTERELGPVDALINGAGGNLVAASTSEQRSFFELPAEALRGVMDLNVLGTILPSQTFGRRMADRKRGIILNIASMNAFRPLTNIPAYSAAKAAVSNFTQWLAVHMCRNYSPQIRVNAIAPGFFLTQQNRFLLVDEATGELTPRGRTIVEHTPMGRFGQPGDLVGTVSWLLSDASAFVTGVVVPVDGGFAAYGGV